MTSCWEQGGLGLLWAYLLIVGKSLYETKRYAWIFRRPRPVLFRPCAPRAAAAVPTIARSTPRLRRFWYTYGSPRIVDRVQCEAGWLLLHHESARARKPKPKVMDIDVRNLALLVHTFSRRFELSFSVWLFSAAALFACLLQSSLLPIFYSCSRNKSAHRNTDHNSKSRFGVLFQARKWVVLHTPLLKSISKIYQVSYWGPNLWQKSTQINLNGRKASKTSFSAKTNSFQNENYVLSSRQKCFFLKIRWNILQFLPEIGLQKETWY